jgi:lipopolysaccharide/colanic/teichoic acid biosynthesis glycosyltransferase
MRSIRRRELLLLLLGDLFFLAAALWLTLLVRYLEVPSAALVELHLVPFSLLFVLWLLVFFIAGFYDPHTRIFRAKLPERILRVQVGNIILAALFFFFVPVFGIAPKTNLVLYLGISFLLIVFWRLLLFPVLFSRYDRSEALLIGGGSEFQELFAEVNHNTRYPFFFSDSISVDRITGGALADRVFAALKNQNLSYVVVDTSHRKLENVLPHLYKPLFSNVEFIDARDLYEEIFQRMPISILGDERALEALAFLPPRPFYETAKRAVDIVGSVILGIPTLALLPLLALAVRLESAGPIFITTLKRIGKEGKEFYAYKFRSMERVEDGVWIGESDNKVTRVGSLMRRTRLDELPQLFNIFHGEISFVGPRPDVAGLYDRLASEIPFYHLRTLVTPGLSGWAQLKQDYSGKNVSPQSVEETKLRFMYDLYYLKHRSLLLDMLIILRTIRVIIARTGS